MAIKDDWKTGDDFYPSDANDVAAEVNSLADALDTKVGAGRLVATGTGLTGGGDLSTDRTLAVTFGTGEGEVCEGDDVRLSDARPPTAHIHGTSGLDEGAVTTAKIGDGQVTAAKLAGPVQASLVLADTARQPGVWVVSSAASGAVSPVAGGADDYNRTALSAACTINNPSGTAQSGQRFTIRLKDNGTARALTWGNKYLGDLPETTTPGETIKLGFAYDEAATKWVLLAMVVY